MSSPTYTQFVQENEELLQQLFNYISQYNKELTFDAFCQFSYSQSY